MYIKIKNEEVNIKKLTKFIDRFKGFKFYLYPIDFGLCYPNKKSFSTYFYCQNFDIIMTDKDYNILYKYINMRSEKLIFYKRKVYYTFIFPTGMIKDIETLNKLKIKGE